jgi:hypothetical protein
MPSRGTLRELATGRLCVLEAEYTIGRAPAPACALRIDRPYVSGVHASVRWNDASGWQLRDLGSRNGTFLDGRRIPSGQDQKLARGATIGFGRLDDTWELVDDSPPPVMLVPVAGGDPIIVEGDLLALPSADDPRVTLYRDAMRVWMLEQPNEPARVLGNRDAFDVQGQLWRFCCPDLTATTIAPSYSAATGLAGAFVRDLHLEFAVSQDEEFVELTAIYRGVRHGLGSRARNYLLLTLARRRLSDAAEGLPETSCGWVNQEEIAHDPSMAPPRLNVEVFRVRDQLSGLGLVDAASAIERRQRPAQLRIGCSQLSVVKI